MGQYYKTYLRFGDGREEAYCSQNALYKTVHGIPAEADAGFDGRRLDDPEGYFYLFSGLKLLEHSWYWNDYVNGILERIWGEPARVAWVGDYADEEADFSGNEEYDRGVYEKVWPRVEGDGLPESPFPEVPVKHPAGFLVNHSKRLYLDLAAYYRACRVYDHGYWRCIHPLPLLTAIGNGAGCGDYRGDYGDPLKNEDLVGAWALDEIEYATEAPAGGYAEVDYGRYAFDSAA